MQQLVTTGRVDTSVLEDAMRANVNVRQIEAVVVGNGDDTNDDDSPLQALYDVVILVKRSKTLFDYLADPELCKAVSKKERVAMLKLSKKLGTYLEDVESAYGGINDDDIPF